MIPQRFKPFMRLPLAAICVYETTALAGCPWPTITRIIYRHRHQVGCRIVVWALLGVLAWHLLVQEDESFAQLIQEVVSQ